MELDDLKGARANPGRTPGGASIDELIPRLRRLRRGLFWRDVRELAAALVLFPVFAWIGWIGYLRREPLMPLLGIGLTLAGLLVITAVLFWARRPRAAAESPMREHLRAELARLDRQILILRHVAWWYVAPIMVGVNLFIAGARGARSTFAITFAIVSLALSIFIVWLNRTGARQLRALREPLRHGLDAIGESGDDGDTDTRGRV
jgi:hypothetical protein